MPLVLILPGILFSIAEIRPETMLLRGPAAAQPAHPFMEVLVDTTGRLSADDVAALDASRFDRNFKLAPRFDPGPQPIWFRLKIENRSSARQWILDLNRSRLDLVELFHISSDGVLPIAFAGQNAGSRDLLRHRENAMRFTLGENRTGVYLIRVENSQLRWAAAVQVFEEQEFVRYDRFETTILGVYFGVLITMVLTNSFFYLALRDYAFLVYVLFLLAFGAVVFYARGFLRQFMPGVESVDLGLGVFVLLHLVNWIGLFFVLLYFRGGAKGFADRLVKWVLVALGAHFVIVLLSIVAGYTAYPRQALVPVMFLIPIPVFFLIFVRLLRGEYAAIYMLFGIGSFIVAALAQMLQQRGFLEYSLLTVNAALVGSALMMVFITLGLADRFRRIEREVERHRLASDTKSTFLAHMSHEIRTPLNAMLGMTELLRESGLNAEQDKYVKVLIRSSRILLGTINDILDISKIEAGQLGLERIRFPPRQLIENLREVFLSEAAGRGIELRSEISADLPRLLRGDPTRLRQILTNLVGNAIKFTEEGHVVMRAFRIASPGEMVQVRFEVEDTGIGIAPEKWEGIFEAFIQADESTTREYGGTGLGLAISRGAVQLMGGRIGIESTPGKGSTFYFTLPFEPVGEIETADEQAGAASEQLRPTTILTGAPRARSRPLAILLAEDNVDNRMLFLAFLKNTPHRIDVAENGAQAVNLFKENSYDVVFMDMQMPVMPGLEAVRKIRELERSRSDGRTTPVFALTAHAFQHERMASMDAGCDGHLTKPMEKSELLDVLQGIQPG